MEKAYREMHPGPPPKTEIAGRDLGEGSEKLRLFVAEKRQEYARLFGGPRRRPATEGCQLCKPYAAVCRQYNAIVYEGLSICPDPFPMYDSHMLILPLRANASERFGVGDGVEPPANMSYDALDCRDYPAEKDITSETKLVRETDYMVMQSMRGSGASIPEHIHSHAIKRSLMKFPLLEEENFSTLRQTERMKAMKLEKLSYGFMLRGDASLYGSIVEGLFRASKLPFNLLITELTSDVVALYFPRIREVPHDPICNGWQFGTTEVLGLFEAKTTAQFNELTYERLCQGLRDTTVQDPNMRQHLEKALFDICNI